jgi:hypothetical protein
MNKKLDFHPVPLRTRHDGWTPDRQRAFISQIRLTGSVDAAARAVGMCRETAYRLRRRPGAESVAAAWDAALRPRGRTHPDLLWHRLLHGSLSCTDEMLRGRSQ